MKTFFTRLFRGLGLLFSVIAMCSLAGCGETDVFVGGRVLDADTEAPLDSAHVSLYHIDKREARLNFAEYSDSLGHFLLYDFGAHSVKNALTFSILYPFPSSKTALSWV